MSEVRRRKDKPAPAQKREPSPEQDDDAVLEKPTLKERIKDEDGVNVPLDIARFLVFLIIAFCGLSYVATGGESYVWNGKTLARYTNIEWWKGLFKGDELLTLEQLAEHDGTNPDKPLYLSINGTVYDVSANRRTYGPGGPYHWFAGVDSSRGFVTGCFETDRTRNIKGVEIMFLPLDDPETDAHWSTEELTELKKTELEEARARVHEALGHWVAFFAKSEKYFRVGRLVMPEGWEDEELPELCDVAIKGRKKRKIPEPASSQA